MGLFRTVEGFLLSLIIFSSSVTQTYADCVQGDCKDGYGWWEWSNGDRYFGFFKKMKRHGLGAFYAQSGSRYEGAWLNDTKDGHGTWTWADGTRYTGKWSQDVHHGHGIYLFSGGEMYEGDYHLGKRHGHGINTWPSGDRYEGNFMLDKRKGYGRLLSTSGSLFEGNWKDDKIDGYGTWVWQNGNLYQGEWLNGERTGYGVYLWSDGMRHMGKWLGSKEHGHGIRVHMGLLWGNKTSTGTWKEGRMITRGGDLPQEFFKSLSRVMKETSEGHAATKITAATALESASHARAAAREAMTLARAAQAISRSKSLNVPVEGCSPLSEFPHGEIHPTLSSYQQGDVVSLSCSSGYQLVGGFPARECNNGQWAGGGAPSCTANSELIASEKVKSTLVEMSEWIKFERERIANSSPSDSSTSSSNSKENKKNQNNEPSSNQEESPLNTQDDDVNKDAEGNKVEEPPIQDAQSSVLRFLRSCGLERLETQLTPLSESLDQLLVSIIRQHELEDVGVWNRDQSSLLACTRDYLLRNITQGH